ncbi:hypothetical protein LOK49_LG06G01744 [Camellia lanceoleosa]|uniref:Uncharacterized protein n=1 Tax=Camellia lanceoleosa TaxID=1840588 RepID=A0ACC0HBD0_9ERIC|nr:hypothetical protein LOK49_LG06G01744 [Camellia lanceoleosa]
MHNAQGKLIDGLACEVNITSAFKGEALAILTACAMCDTLNLSKVEIEGDNKRAIKLSVSEDVPPWECPTIFADIRAMAQQLVLTCRWCPRCANGAAHWAARARLGGHLPVNWVASNLRYYQKRISLPTNNIFFFCHQCKRIPNR